MADVDENRESAGSGANGGGLDAGVASWRAHVVALGGSSRFAIEQVLRAVPANVGRCYVVAYTGRGDITPSVQLASSLPVRLVEHGTAPEVDQIYVVPPGHDATLARGVFELSEPGEEDGRASLDRLFRSLASELGPDATCIVLSGSGVDGALGLKRVKEHDGLTIAQAPADAEDPQMPMAAIDTGLVDLIAPASEIGSRLVAMTPLDGESAEDERSRRETAADTLRDILTLVRIRTGHDFSLYKRPTLLRRVARRMQVCERPTLADYHRYVREHPGELSHLLRDFLISVTNFFRDADAFDQFAHTVVPQLFAGKTSGDQVRVWVAGCATGEEVYSLGMLLLEHASQLSNPPSVQLFATDIDEDALAEARAGRYSEQIVVDVSAERLARFFIHEAHEYRVTKELRELVLFSPHDLLRDPPFSRLDLISCRNVLIYLNREAQDRVLSTFHFGLRPDGHLFLGSSEAVESASTLFCAIDGKARLFSRRATLVEVVLPAASAATRWRPSASVPPAVERPSASFGDIHHRIVEYYAAPSVIVNDELDVLHMSEHAGRFLQLAGGEPTRQLLRLVHPGLRVGLRTAIYAARQSGHEGEGRTMRYENADGEARAVHLRVRPVSMPDVGSGLLLVMFDESDVADARDSVKDPPASIEPIVRELEDDLQHTRDQLRTSVEQYETSLEELKASNEELQAINEELRSATEELETSKEELQSVNEELTTLNYELKGKVDEINRANSDFQNLMTSTDLAVLFLDRSIQIKWFTRRSLDLFNLIATDVGRPLAHVTHRLAVDDLTATAREVLQTLRVVEREVLTLEGGNYLLRALPYRSLEDRIDGVVLTFVDIGELRRTEAALRASDARFRLALSASPAIATMLDANGTCTWAYALGHELPASSNLAPFLSPAEAERLAALVAAARCERAVQHTEVTMRIEKQIRVFDVRVEPLVVANELTGLVAVGFEITANKQAEAALREIDRRKDEFLATLSHELRNPLTPLRVALDVQKLAPDDATQTQRTRAIMERQVDHLIALVDDLLDLSRITQGKIELVRQDVDVREAVTAAIEDTRSLAESMHHRVTTTLPAVPVVVHGDRTRLVQIVVNLVANACKYTPDGGSIYVDVRRDDERRRASIAVRDTGMGLEPVALSEIFELFAQCRDARGRSRGGLGIGLNLVRRLVEVHGGEVRATSPGLGAGSTFTVELPLQG